MEGFSTASKKPAALTGMSECFVFDRRVGVDGELNETTSEVCWACREPLTPEQAASPEFVRGVFLPILHWLKKTGIDILNSDVSV